MIDYIFGLSVRVLLTNDDGKVLILKRSTDSKTNPGKWELPGGKVDQGESFDHALVREVYEETKLKISLEHVVGVTEQNLKVIRAVHIIMSGKIIEGNLTLSKEHEGYAWVFLENLDEYELADWLQDFITNQKTSTTSDVNESKNILSETVKPWLKSLQTSMDKIIKK
ncbi:MAG: NUDIX domain-containing protein [Methanobacteriaceae archaeon]|nr:NUDIX domain-containing protein [Methanobacteriaceae archaeon]